VEGETMYCPKTFIKIGMETKERYLKKRPERLKGFHEINTKNSLIAMQDC
jgi:hypothetical protein